VITRLTTRWQGEATAFKDWPLAATDYVCLWVDGIHLKVRLKQDVVSLLVMIGGCADGRRGSGRPSTTCSHASKAATTSPLSLRDRNSRSRSSRFR